MSTNDQKPSEQSSSSSLTRSEELALGIVELTSRASAPPPPPPSSSLTRSEEFALGIIKLTS